MKGSSLEKSFADIVERVSDRVIDCEGRGDDSIDDNEILGGNDSVYASPTLVRTSRTDSSLLAVSAHIPEETAEAFTNAISPAQAPAK
jgi:hypothetical protein